MNPISADIGSILADEGVATPGVNLFAGPEQESDQVTVSITETGGDANPKWLRDDTTIQTRIRGLRNDYQSALSKAQEVKDTLLGVYPLEIGGTHYVRFIIQSDIAYVGQDENQRPLLTINWIVTREYDSGGNRTPL